MLYFFINCYANYCGILGNFRSFTFNYKYVNHIITIYFYKNMIYCDDINESKFALDKANFTYHVGSKLERLVGNIAMADVRIEASLVVREI